MFDDESFSRLSTRIMSSASDVVALLRELLRVKLVRWVRPPNPPGRSSVQRPTVFMVFSNKDRGLADELYRHLLLLEQQQFIKLQRIDDFPPGTNIIAERARRFRQAKVVLVLVSVDLLMDELLNGLPSLQGAGQLDQRIIPVPLRRCEWRSTPLGVLQPMPENGLPVAMAQDREDVLASIASSLRRLLTDAERPRR